MDAITQKIRIVVIADDEGVGLVSEYMKKAQEDFPEALIVSICVSSTGHIYNYLKEIKEEREGSSYLIDPTAKLVHYFHGDDFTATEVNQISTHIAKINELVPPPISLNDLDLMTSMKTIEETLKDKLDSLQCYIVQFDSGIQFVFIKDVFIGKVLNAHYLESKAVSRNLGVWEHHVDKMRYLKINKCGFTSNEQTDTILRRIFQRFVSLGLRLDVGDEIQHHREITARNTSHMELAFITRNIDAEDNINDITQNLREKHNLGSIRVNTITSLSTLAEIEQMFRHMESANGLMSLHIDGSVDNTSVFHQQVQDLWETIAQ